jgi:hypothetical protein
VFDFDIPNDIMKYRVHNDIPLDREYMPDAEKRRRREAALHAGHKTYLSVACKTCGGKERYTKTKHCVVCARKAHREYKRRRRVA